MDVYERVISTRGKYLCTLASGNQVDSLNRLYETGECDVIIQRFAAQMLMCAAENGHQRIAIFLFMNGFLNPSANYTPVIKTALRRGRTQFVDQLRDLGVEVDDVEEEWVEVGDDDIVDEVSLDEIIPIPVSQSVMYLPAM